MVEMGSKALDEKKVVGGVLTDLSKAFDCLPHDLMIAKLHAYGFERSALKFVHSYLTERTQRTKVDGDTSSCDEIILIRDVNMVLISFFLAFNFLLKCC